MEQQSGTANGAFYIYREYTNVPLVEGKTYRLEVDAYGSNGSFILMYHNNSWIGSTGSKAVTQQIYSVAGAWTPMSITFTATAEDVAAGKTRISLDVRNTWEGTMYFDNVRLIDVEAEAASRPAPVELLADNFDSGIAGWAPVSSAATLTQEDGSLSITKPATGASGSYYISKSWSGIKLEAGKTYRLDVEFKGDISAHYLVVDNRSSVGGSGTMVLQSPNMGQGSANEWKPFSYEFTVNEANAIT